MGSFCIRKHKFSLCGLIILSLLSGQGFAQKPPSPTPAASIHNAAALSAFFKRLDQRQDRHLDLMHWGDSHVQMGYFSRSIRLGIDSMFGISGYGLTFPYRVAGYNPFHSQSLKLTGKWQGGKILDAIPGHPNGIAGFHAATLDSMASITFGLRGITENLPPAHKITVYYGMDTSAVISFSGRHFQQDSNTVHEPVLVETRAFPNDSTPFYQTTLFFDDPVDMISVDVRNDHPENGVILWGAVFDQAANKGIGYHNAGVGGAQFTHLIHSGALHLLQAATLDPALIILSFGSNESYTATFNDSAYRSEINAYLQKIKNLLPGASILLTGPPDTRSKNRYPRNTAAICTILREAADTQGCAYFDLRQGMGGDGSIYAWLKKGLASKDLLHFTPAGYTQQGKWLVDALGQAYQTYLEREKHE